MRPYKNRRIDTLKPVEIYKNLHKNVYSVRQNGRVAAHAKELLLENACFKVSEAGRQRVIREQRKNVHAIIKGYLTSSNPKFVIGEEIYYNPYTVEGFVVKRTGELIDKCKLVWLLKEGVFGDGISIT